MSPEASELARWRAEPWVFVNKVLRAEPDDWQDEALHALVAGTFQRFALQACKGPGKSAFLAWVMWWFMVTRPMPKIVATSISADNLEDNLWAELSKWQKHSRMLQATFEWTKDRVYERRNPETWFMSARSWPKTASPEQQADTLAGIHADHVLFVLDESGGIPPAVMTTAEAGLANVDKGAGREALLLQAGNPTELTGALYAAAERHRSLWWVKEISGDPDDPKRAKRVSIEWARSQIAQHGRDHPWVLVNVMGKFPPGASNALISLNDVTAAARRTVIEAAYCDEPKILGVDVARFGGDETVICPRQGPVVMKMKVSRDEDLMKVTGHVARTIQNWNPDAVFIDETGLGAGVVDRLHELKYPVIGVNFAQKASKRGFLNRRAEMWGDMAEWVRGEVCLPDDPQLIGEMPGPTYWYNSSNKLVLESKDDMKARGLPSPNRADALALTFAAPVAHHRLTLANPRTAQAKTDYDWRTGKPR